MEFEVKYTYPNHRAGFIRELLSYNLEKDGSFPEGIITSIYYDTVDMLYYEEKRASTYLKKKVRLRWYLDANTKKADDTAFWEVKNRIGTQREKSRKPSLLKPNTLNNIELSDPRLLCESMRQQLNIGDSQLLYPTVMLRYTRQRFIDKVTGSRVNIDSNIHARKINRNLANENSLSCLPIGVIEYKGIYDGISPYLSNLGLLGAKKQAFSKYESVIKWVKSNQQLF